MPYNDITIGDIKELQKDLKDKTKVKTIRDWQGRIRKFRDKYELTATGLDGSTASVLFTATAATVANVTAGLVTAWNASTKLSY